MVAKPLFTVGLRLRDRGSDGMVKVSESAKTGVEKFVINKLRPNKIANTYATLCACNKRGRRADERSDKTSALKSRLLFTI